MKINCYALASILKLTINTAANMPLAKQLSEMDQKSLANLTNCWVAIFKGQPPTLIRDDAGSVINGEDQVRVQVKVMELLGESYSKKRIAYAHVAPNGDLHP